MIELPRPGKDSVVVQNPVMPAAGMLGYDGTAYRDVIDLGKLGALVTTPLTWKPRRAARGPRVVPIPSGVLIHTGLPNPGVARAIKQYAGRWAGSVVPVIVHLAATTPEDVAHAAAALDRVEAVAGIELGLHDSVAPADVINLVGAVLDNTQRPLLVRVPLHNALALALAAQEAEAGGVVVASPPRGTARDSASGQLVGGRIFGPWLHTLTLRAVGQVARALDIPVIGSGGAHSADDAREFIAAGAVAVQIDTLAWTQPHLLEVIARNLGGLELTRQAGALADEWEPGIGETMIRRRQQPYDGPDAPSIPSPRPPSLPEEDFL